MTVDEGAALLGISRPKMYELVHSDACTFAIHIGRRILISRSALEKWLLDQAGAGK
jgi:excisionase family DNA binding protein